MLLSDIFTSLRTIGWKGICWIVLVTTAKIGNSSVACCCQVILDERYFQTKQKVWQNEEFIVVRTRALLKCSPSLVKYVDFLYPDCNHHAHAKKVHTKLISRLILSPLAHLDDIGPTCINCLLLCTSFFEDVVDVVSDEHCVYICGLHVVTRSFVLNWLLSWSSTKSSRSHIVC
jgi:hypothetical protein